MRSLLPESALARAWPGALPRELRDRAQPPPGMRRRGRAVCDTPTLDALERCDEPIHVLALARIEPKHLLVKVRVEVERAHGDIRPVQRALHAVPKVFNPLHAAVLATAVGLLR